MMTNPIIIKKCLQPIHINNIEAVSKLMLIKMKLMKKKKLGELVLEFLFIVVSKDCMKTEIEM
jgi:hypothetical protein